MASSAVRDFNAPFTALWVDPATMVTSAAQPQWIAPLLFTVWACGFAAILGLSPVQKALHFEWPVQAVGLTTAVLAGVAMVVLSLLFPDPQKEVCPVHPCWVSLWTATWYVGISVFSLLSVLVIIFGGYDLAALLTSLRARHLAAQEADGAGGGTGQ